MQGFYGFDISIKFSHKLLTNCKYGEKFYVVLCSSEKLFTLYGQQF